MQQAAFGAFSGSMPPGRAATLRCMPLTRYECFGRPHNPVHYFSSELRFSWHGNSPHSLPVAFMQQACIRTQLHLANRSKRCTPALKGFVTAAVLRSLGHGNSLHSQPVASFALRSFSAHLAAGRSLAVVRWPQVAQPHSASCYFATGAVFA